jgi:CHRD domain
MKRFGLHAALATALLIVLGVGSYAIAGGNSSQLRTRGLIGYAENPDVSTVATGTFRGTLDRAANTITYRLTYTGLEGAVSQAHIHFGKAGVNGGIVLFLCTNLGNGPVGTQACPAAPATVTGVLGPGDIVDAAAGQGITGSGVDADEWEEIERATRAGRMYANVHSAKFPGGEVRAQIRNRGNDD